MTTKLDSKFTNLLNDTATKLQSLDVAGRVLETSAPTLLASANEIARQLTEFTSALAVAQEEKFSADFAEKEAAILARDLAAAEKAAEKARVLAEREAAKLAAAEAKIKAMEEKEAARLAKEQAAAEKAAERARLEAEREAERKAAAEAKFKAMEESEAARLARDQA